MLFYDLRPTLADHFFVALIAHPRVVRGHYPATRALRRCAFPLLSSPAALRARDVHRDYDVAMDADGGAVVGLLSKQKQIFPFLHGHYSDLACYLNLLLREPMWRPANVNSLGDRKAALALLLFRDSERSLCA